jgi:phosphoglycerate dehydrogenase-like enzyme
MSENETTVLFIWEVNDILKKYFAKHLVDLPHLHLIYPESTEETCLLRYAPRADIMVGWRPSLQLLKEAKKLSLFINPGAGVQHIVGKFREVNKSRQVILVNNHGNAYFTAQHGLALLLVVMNKVITHHNWMVEGEWRMGDSDAISIPLRDKNVGLLGYGEVNRRIHQMMSGFDVRFLALTRDWSKHKGPYPAEVEKFKTGELDEFLKQSDILIISIPETDETRGLIRLKELRLLGEKGLLVNLARGNVVDEESLYKSLKDGVIAGASIDVWYEYSPQPDDDGKKYPFHFPFHKLGNVVLSPHRGASPFSDLKRWEDVIENIRRFATGIDDFKNLVDLDAGY